LLIKIQGVICCLREVLIFEHKFKRFFYELNTFRTLLDNSKAC